MPSKIVFLRPPKLVSTKTLLLKHCYRRREGKYVCKNYVFRVQFLEIVLLSDDFGIMKSFQIHWATPPVRLGLSGRNSGKIPERPRKRSQSVSWNSPEEYGWDAPNPIIQGIWGFQSVSRILSPPVRLGTPLSSELVPERASQSRSWNSQQYWGHFWFTGCITCTFVTCTECFYLFDYKSLLSARFGGLYCWKSCTQETFCLNGIRETKRNSPKLHVSYVHVTIFQKIYKK